MWKKSYGLFYYDAWTTGTVAKPTVDANSYDFTDRTFDNLTAGWSVTKGTPPYAFSTYSVIETVYGGAQTILFQNPVYIGNWIGEDPDDLGLIWNSETGGISLNFGGSGAGSIGAPNIMMNSYTTWEDLTDSGSGNANIPADSATNNNVYNGNTTLRGNTTGTAGDFFFDETLNELYIWE